jgi:hypothetical protein
VAGPAVDEEPPPPKMPAERIVRDAEEAYLAVCLGVKDQNEDLREWIEYHRSIGVGKFYIFDDNSTVPAAVELQDLIQEGKSPEGRFMESAHTVKGLAGRLARHQAPSRSDTIADTVECPAHALVPSTCQSRSTVLRRALASLIMCCRLC